MAQKKKQFLIFSAIIGILLAGSFAYGANDASEYVGKDPLLDHSPLCPHRIFNNSELLDKFHNPTDWIQMGFDFRFRWVYAKNAITQNTRAANNEWHFTRQRSRLSTKFKLSEDVDFNTRLVWEWFHWDKGPRGGQASVDLDEIIFDHFNFTIRNLFDAPLTAVIGRQEIILGDGWLVLEGTPADGSRTIFFDAARFTYQINEENKADIIFIYQFDDQNKWLSPINHRKRNANRALTYGKDEKGFIFYLSNTSFEDTTIDAYYIYKKDGKSRGSTVPFPVASPKRDADAEIHTLGLRIAKKLDENWRFRGEIAKQFGRKNRRKLDALGGTTRLTYAFNDENKNELFADYEYLSGDKPGTRTDEGFDPLWGNYPQFARGGDLQSYVWTTEGALGIVSNLHRVGFGHRFSPFEKWSFETSYNVMFADTNAMRNINANKYSSGGNLRGQMLTAYWRYRCCKNLSLHLLADYFLPGSYYDQSNRNACWFTRFNIEFTF